MNRNKLYKGTFNSDVFSNICGEIELVAKFNKKNTIEDKNKKFCAFIKYKENQRSNTLLKQEINPTFNSRMNEVFQIEIEPLAKSKLLENNLSTVAKKIHMGIFSSQIIEATINLGSFPNFIEGKYACSNPSDHGKFKMSLTNEKTFSFSILNKNNTECIIL